MDPAMSLANLNARYCLGAQQQRMGFRRIQRVWKLCFGGGIGSLPSCAACPVQNGASLSHPIGSYTSCASIARICALCNEASLLYAPRTMHCRPVGEVMEAALKVLVEKIGFPDKRRHQVRLFQGPLHAAELG